MTTSTTSTTSLTAATEELRSGLKTQLGAVLDSLDAGATELGARTLAGQGRRRRGAGLRAPRRSRRQLDARRPAQRRPRRPRLLPRRLVPVLQPAAARVPGRACGHSRSRGLARRDLPADARQLAHPRGAGRAGVPGPERRRQRCRAQLRARVRARRGRPRAAQRRRASTSPPSTATTAGSCPRRPCSSSMPDGTIRYASVAGDYRWRVGPDEVLAALRA